MSASKPGWSRDPNRGSRHERGYDSAWVRLRLVILDRDDHLCQCEDCRGGLLQLKVATEVDHIVSKAKARAMGWSAEQIEDPKNLQAINSECHRKKTQKENGGTPKQRIGLDGFPIQVGSEKTKESRDESMQAEESQEEGVK